MTSAAQRIDHVVVLMLENRSFDHMLAFLDHPNPSYERIPDGAGNALDPDDPESQIVPATDEAQFVMPFDPDHSHEGALVQLANGGAGFVASYLAKRRLGPTDPLAREYGRAVMACMSPERIPALATLAREYAICTRWYSSVPGETWPNRNFAHAGTSDRTMNIEFGLYEDPTIFEQLSDGDVSWHVYHDGPAQVMAFKRLWMSRDRLRNWHPLHEFDEHVRDGTLPAYSFIEPNHHTPGARLFNGRSSSQHPGNNLVDIAAYRSGEWEDEAGADFRRGDALVAWVYETLRNQPDVFERTLLLITYDEHGGLYDHVAPERTVAPGDDASRGLLRSVIEWAVPRNEKWFDFSTTGARVPAVAVSPWIEPGRLDPTVYDHASIVSTVRQLFVPNAGHLTNRDRDAKLFLHLVEERGEARSGDELPSLSEKLTRYDRELRGAVPELLVEIPQPPTELERGLAALARIVSRYAGEGDVAIEGLAEAFLTPLRVEVRGELGDIAAAMVAFEAKALDARSA